MSREILFRGKRTDNKCWIYGFYLKDPKKGNMPYILSNSGKIRVAHRSVGEFTGLDDKNGIKIFEHDICRDSLGTLFVVKWDKKNSRFIGLTIEKEHRIIHVGREPRVEVIGNVFDNPELLEEGEKI